MPRSKPGLAERGVDSLDAASDDGNAVPVGIKPPAEVEHILLAAAPYLVRHQVYDVHKCFRYD